MNRKQMLKELSYSGSSLEVSIKKWEDIVYRRGTDEGSDNCALCEKHREPSPDGFKYTCSTCPVALHTDTGFCNHTPFVKWHAHQQSIHNLPEERIRCTTCRELAQVELDFLISLRQEEQ